jgi:surface antigen
MYRYPVLPFLQAMTAAAVLCSGLTAAPAALASNGWGAFNDGPSAQFNDQDWKLLKAAALDVLNDAAPNASREWQNAATGHHGTVLALKSYQSPDGRECRKLQFDSVAADRKGRATHSICRPTGGAWRLDS